MGRQDRAQVTLVRRGGLRDGSAIARLTARPMMTVAAARAATTWAALAFVAAVVLGGCFGDPPPDPATAPLEVVVEGCVLNRPEVAPGAHAVAVVNHDKLQPGQLVVSGEDGEQVLRVSIGSAEQLLVTTAQTYTFSCSVGGSQSTSTLVSKAR